MIVAGQYSVKINLLSDQLACLTCQLTKSRFQDEVRRVMALHHALCTLFVRFNKAFDILLLQSVVLPFVITIVNIYTAILCIVKPESL